MRRLIKLLTWLDENLIKLLFLAFVLLVPLYPKIPFVRMEYTYIAIRFEDFFIFFLILIFIVQLLRKKNKLNTTFLVPMLLFWLFVFASFIYSSFFLKTIVHQQIAFLNAARRVEYMIVFFIASSVIKSKRDLWQVLIIFSFAFAISSLYGLGQRFLNFPAIQTMNPEYARGRVIYLTPEARISSTFAGHYDFAMYLVFGIPLILALYFQTKRQFFLLVFITALTALFYTAARASFAAYLVSVTLLLLFFRKYFVYLFILSLTFNIAYITGDLAKRFSQTFQVKQILVNENTGQVYVPQTNTVKDLPVGSLQIPLKKQDVGDTTEIQTYKDSVIQTIISVTPPPTPIPKATIILPTPTPMYYEERKLASEAANLIASLSASLKIKRSILPDISFSTRLQVEWPRAIIAFRKSPILGTGPSSLTEATDNDFLRWLGEFGLLGTSAFLYLIFAIALFIWKRTKKLASNERYVFYAVIFSTLALLINATYFDVFEASKVAYTFWLTLGSYVGFLQLTKTKT